MLPLYITYIHCSRFKELLWVTHRNKWTNHRKNILSFNPTNGESFNTVKYHCIAKAVNCTSKPINVYRCKNSKFYDTIKHSIETTEN